MTINNNDISTSDYDELMNEYESGPGYWEAAEEEWMHCGSEKELPCRNRVEADIDDTMSEIAHKHQVDMTPEQVLQKFIESGVTLSDLPDEVMVHFRPIFPQGGMFIVFEGIDGSGKTTQAKELTRRLISGGYHDTHLLREPGSTEVGESIRGILLNENLLPRTRVLLFNAARSELINDKIEPLLRRQAIVICDRFTQSTVAYQGYGGGECIEWIEWNNNYSTNGRKPDLTIYMDIDPDVAIARKTPGTLDEIERKDREFRRKVCNGYIESKKKNHRFVSIDAERSPHEIASEVYQIVIRMIQGR